MMKVKIERGAISTILRTSVAIRPDSSATPTPIIATMITPDRAEAEEVRHDRGEHEADAVGREQAADRGGLGDDLVGRRIDGLVGRRPADEAEDHRQDDDDADQEEEDDGRVRHLVADPLDRREKAVEEAALRPPASGEPSVSRSWRSSQPPPSAASYASKLLFYTLDPAQTIAAYAPRDAPYAGRDCAGK